MDNVDGYSCNCLLGFEGQRCKANTDEFLGRICANGGRCIDGLNRYRCQCRPGFFGRHCQRMSDACLRRPCFNGRECISIYSRRHFYKCLCRTGYLGARCEIQAARCVHTWLQNGGTCTCVRLYSSLRRSNQAYTEANTIVQCSQTSYF